MISKIQFVNIMKELKKLNSQNSNDFDVIISQNSLLELLCDSFNDEKALKQWMFEKNYGESVENDLSSPYKFYDYLVSHKKDFVKGTTRKKITTEELFEYMLKKENAKNYDNSVTTVSEVMTEFNTTKYEASLTLNKLKEIGKIRQSVQFYDPVTGKILEKGNNLSLIKRGWRICP